MFSWAQKKIPFPQFPLRLVGASSGFPNSRMWSEMMSITFRYCIKVPVWSLSSPLMSTIVQLLKKEFQHKRKSSLGVTALENPLESLLTHISLEVRKITKAIVVMMLPRFLELFLFVIAIVCFLSWLSHRGIWWWDCENALVPLLEKTKSEATTLLIMVVGFQSPWYAFKIPSCLFQVGVPRCFNSKIHY